LFSTFPGSLSLLFMKSYSHVSIDQEKCYMYSTPKCLSVKIIVDVKYTD
jgi:hypothetical protein